MTPKPVTENTLFYGDNLPILREHVPDESVDLIYLDSPSAQTFKLAPKAGSPQEEQPKLEL
jgi:site-specific DNA-methyltransferase (adenine-specific)